MTSTGAGARWPPPGPRDPGTCAEPRSGISTLFHSSDPAKPRSGRYLAADDAADGSSGMSAAVILLGHCTPPALAFERLTSIGAENPSGPVAGRHGARSRGTYSSPGEANDSPRALGIRGSDRCLATRCITSGVSAIVRRLETDASLFKSESNQDRITDAPQHQTFEEERRSRTKRRKLSMSLQVVAAA